MQTDYTEQDTERARESERASSAGVQTSPLGRLPQGYAGPGVQPASDRNRTMAALALIAIGVISLMGQLFQGQLEIEGGMVLLSIASGFLFFAFWQRIYGLLIPGSILAGLSLGVTFAELTNGVSVMWGLALGFMAILFFGRTLFGVRHPWPAIPAVILFLVGVVVAAASLPAFFAGGLLWLPLLLIGAGLVLGWGRRP